MRLCDKSTWLVSKRISLCLSNRDSLLISNRLCQEFSLDALFLSFPPLSFYRRINRLETRTFHLTKEHVLIQPLPEEFSFPPSIQGKFHLVGRGGLVLVWRDYDYRIPRGGGEGDSGGKEKIFSSMTYAFQTLSMSVCYEM